MEAISEAADLWAKIGGFGFRGFRVQGFRV